MAGAGGRTLHHRACQASSALVGSPTVSAQGLWPDGPAPRRAAAGDGFLRADGRVRDSGGGARSRAAAGSLPGLGVEGLALCLRWR